MCAVCVSRGLANFLISSIHCSTRVLLATTTVTLCTPPGVDAAANEVDGSDALDATLGALGALGALLDVEDDEDATEDERGVEDEDGSSVDDEGSSVVREACVER